MVHCCVPECNIYTSTRPKHRFFNLPSVVTNQCDKTWNLSSRRRNLWIQRINRSKLPVYPRICDRHFVKGQPSHLFDDENIDWAPTLHLGREEKMRQRRGGKNDKEYVEFNKMLSETPDEHLVVECTPPFFDTPDSDHEVGDPETLTLAPPTTAVLPNCTATPISVPNINIEPVLCDEVSPSSSTVLPDIRKSGRKRKKPTKLCNIEVNSSTVLPDNNKSGKKRKIKSDSSNTEVNMAPVLSDTVKSVISVKSDTVLPDVNKAVLPDSKEIDMEVQTDISKNYITHLEFENKILRKDLQRLRRKTKETHPIVIEMW